ncbi:alanine aminotransferase 2-like [Thalassophryne amazonica]|uniref:alanine aminotransferase 2-like n=1 Tax=Thalassophryne amazonica TaxID=390379 RepID=UPI0014718E60|nr:alanine aminotransferase 2-like [Thalassophryne amazonica]
MPPLTFVRQVLAACLYSDLLGDENFPLDVRLRAQRLLQECPGGSVGSYSTLPCGLPYVHQSIAEFITRRDDGVPSYTDDIVIYPGSLKALMIVVKLLTGEEAEHQTGVLTPVPCPHTLPVLLDQVGVTLVPYHLREDQDWALDMDKLHLALKTARGSCNPRAIYISNPGNPTGHVQERKTIENVIKFAASEGLFLLVDEVNQGSVYGEGRSFLSYKKVLFEMGQKYSDMVEMVSFHSISGAHFGECCLRGGYLEAINMDPAVKTYLKVLKGLSSPPVLPQLVLELLANPPMPGDPSYETYRQELVSSQTTLSQNAQRACDFLNTLPGMSCRPAMGGIYTFARLQLPCWFIKEAKALGVQADALYCQRLLEQEGVCVGAGSDNGQLESNYYIRFCVLVPPATLDEILTRISSLQLHLQDNKE